MSATVGVQKKRAVRGKQQQRRRFPTSTFIADQHIKLQQRAKQHQLGVLDTVLLEIKVLSAIRKEWHNVSFSSSFPAFPSSPSPFSPVLSGENFANVATPVHFGYTSTTASASLASPSYTPAMFSPSPASPSYIPTTTSYKGSASPVSPSYTPGAYSPVRPNYSPYSTSYSPVSSPLYAPGAGPISPVSTHK